MWHPYAEATTNKIEEFFQKQGGQGVIAVDDYSFDFTKQVSFRQGASKNKHLRRGSWFFLEQGKWIPYEPQASVALETIWQKGEFGAVQVSKDPKRIVEYRTGTFTQIEPKTNQTRPVHRGWNGLIFETVIEVTTTIKTVARDCVVTGPGAPPYSKVVQPGLIQPPQCYTGGPVMVQTCAVPAYATGQVVVTGQPPYNPEYIM